MIVAYLCCHLYVFYLFLQDSEKRTPMHAAAYCGETECVVALVRSGRPLAPSHYVFHPLCQNSPSLPPSLPLFSLSLSLPRR